MSATISRRTTVGGRMGYEHGDWRIDVLRGGGTDDLADLTRALRKEFPGKSTVEGEAHPAPERGKGIGDVAFDVAAVASARAAAQVLVTLIREWCAKERDRKVEVSFKDMHVVISARPDEVQERLIRELVEKAAESDEGSGQPVVPAPPDSSDFQ